MLDSLPRSRALVVLDQNGFLMPTEPVTPPNSKVWKVVHFPIMSLVVAIGLLVVGGIATQMVALVVRAAGHIGTPALLIAPVVGAAIVTTVYWVFVRKVERRREFVEFELPGWWQELGGSFGLGLVLFSVVFWAIVLGGGFQVVGFNSPKVILVPLVSAICTAFIEEIILRGLFFRLVERLLGSWMALVLSALLFGAAHFANPDATLSAGVAIALEYGIVLAAIYMVTRRLWAAIGLHAAWSFAQSGIYGLAISGYGQRGLLDTVVQDGSDLLTGGRFGAEGSVSAILVNAALSIVLLVIAVKRGRIVAPAWTRNVNRAQRRALQE